MHGYKVSERLSLALKGLFKDPTLALNALGVGTAFPDAIKKNAADPEIPPIERIRTLRVQLEGYIINMSKEVDELGESERFRLQCEATGYLISLRELVRFFPEAF